MNQLSKQEAVTLTELIISVVLLGTVFLAATTFNLASYNFYYSADKFVQTQLAISPAMEKIVKDASLQSGDLNDMGRYLFPAGCVNNCNEVHIRMDYNANTPPLPNNTPGDYNDDTWVGFWSDVNHNLWYCDNCNGQQSVAGCGGCMGILYVLTNKLITGGFILTRNDPDCKLDINVTGRFDPSKSPNEDNPEVTFLSSVCPRSLSLK